MIKIAIISLVKIQNYNVIYLQVFWPSGFSKGPSNPESMDPVLFLPLVDNEHLPEKIRKFFRFGVPDIPPHSRSISKSLNGSHKSNQDEKKLPETLLLAEVEELESVV